MSNIDNMFLDSFEMGNYIDLMYIARLNPC